MFLSHFLEMWFRARSVFLQLRVRLTWRHCNQPTNQKPTKKGVSSPFLPHPPPQNIKSNKFTKIENNYSNRQEGEGEGSSPRGLFG